MATRHLRSDETGDADAGWARHPRDVRVDESKPCQLLPKLEETRAERGAGGLVRCDPAAGAEGSTLWIPANRQVIATRRLGGESQAGVAADARGQSIEHPPSSFCRHNG